MSYWFAVVMRALPLAARILRQDLLVYVIITLYTVAGVGMLHAAEMTSSYAYLAYFPMWPLAFFIIFPFLYFMLGVFWVVHRFDQRRNLAFRAVFTEQRFAHFVAAMVLLSAIMIFQSTFTSIKSTFPLWNGGFPHDVIQADIDRVLHFGLDPWRYLNAIAPGGMARSVIEWNYNQGWFVICYATLFWVAVSSEADAIRTRYITSYVLVWIVTGNLLAMAFLSAGPVYYGHATGDYARFAELTSFLAESSGGMHSASRIQNYLWALHTTRDSGIGSGVSAFPSMHVGLMTLNALFAWEYSRRLGIAAFIYVAFLTASSVYLGWHYAIDGYVGAAMTVVVYAVVRRYLPARQICHRSPEGHRPLVSALTVS